MSRFSALLFVSALSIATSIAFGNELSQVSTPMTHLVLHDKLYTTIHTNVQRMHGSYFSGTFVGKFETTGGGGSYNGRFSGKTKAKQTKVNFRYNVGGTSKSMGFNVKYGGNIGGKVSVRGQKIAVNAYYNINANGTLHGMRVKGSCTGKAYFTAAYGKFYYYEHGHSRLYIAGKLINAMYYATLNKDSIRVAVYGMYGGKRFFVKYSFSLNLLPLGLDMNPMMIKRNYGTVYANAGGKKFTRKYDMKGLELPQLS